jgi:hypothetical protein
MLCQPTTKERERRRLPAVPPDRDPGGARGAELQSAGSGQGGRAGADPAGSGSRAEAGEHTRSRSVRGQIDGRAHARAARWQNRRRAPPATPARAADLGGLDVHGSHERRECRRRSAGGWRKIGNGKWEVANCQAFSISICDLPLRVASGKATEGASSTTEIARWRTPVRPAASRAIRKRTFKFTCILWLSTTEIARWRTPVRPAASRAIRKRTFKFTCILWLSTTEIARWRTPVRPAASRAIRKRTFKFTCILWLPPLGGRSSRSITFHLKVEATGIVSDHRDRFRLRARLGIAQAAARRFAGSPGLERTGLLWCSRRWSPRCG